MSKGRKYLIALEETRSKVALAEGLIVFTCTMIAVFHMIASFVGSGKSPFMYFTVLSNFFSAVAAAFMIPYAYEGIRKKRFVLPKIIVRIQYSCTICVFITMLISLAIILPFQGIKAVTGANFWLHIITPISAGVLFQCVESNVKFSRRDMRLCQIPYWTYMTVYLIMVILIGEENGGWPDIYMVKKIGPFWLIILIMLIIGFIIADLLRFLHNRLVDKGMKRIEKGWTEDLEPTELLIEAFGLGRYIGSKSDDGEITIPVDILEFISGKYNVSVEDLSKAFVKGALDSLKELNSLHNK